MNGSLAIAEINRRGANQNIRNNRSNRRPTRKEDLPRCPALELLGVRGVRGVRKSIRPLLVAHSCKELDAVLVAEGKNPMPYHLSEKLNPLPSLSRHFQNEQIRVEGPCVY